MAVESVGSGSGTVSQKMESSEPKAIDEFAKILSGALAAAPMGPAGMLVGGVMGLLGSQKK